MKYQIIKTNVHVIGDEKYYCAIVHFDLKSPYILSFGTIDVFKTLYVIKEKDGVYGIGEVTALPGYSPETIENLWASLNDHLGGLSESPVCYGEGFCVAALNTCLESFEQKLLYEDVEFSAKSVQFIDHPRDASIEVAKLKIGRSVSDDLNKVRKAQAFSYKLRMDANQGYGTTQAKNFLGNISPRNIEYVEQLIAKDRWHEMGRMAAEYPKLSFLLDESICSIEDIDKAKHYGAANAIKLKLFKCGSMANTLETAKYAMNQGFEVVLGNGVQTIVGAFYEAYCYNKLINYANFNDYSEINGPYKIKGFKNMKENIIKMKSKEIKKFVVKLLFDIRRMQ